MFHLTFPEGDPFERSLVEPDRLLGRMAFEKAGKGVMVREVVPEGIACSYEEGGWRISVSQTEERISLGVGKFMEATYDRDTGGLVSFEVSLAASAIMASKLKVKPGVERAGNAWEMLEMGQDIRMLVDFMGRKAGITFFRTNNRDEVVEVYPGATLNDIGEGTYPQIVFQEWHGKTPFCDLPVRVLVEEQGIQVIIQDKVKGWSLPVSAYFHETVTSDLKPKELKVMIDSVYPSENYSKD